MMEEEIITLDLSKEFKRMLRRNDKFLRALGE